MFRSALYHLEKNIGELPDTIATGDQDAINSKLSSLAAAMKSADANIRNVWMKQVLGNGKENSLRRYIQYEQAVITQLSDRVYENITDQHSTTVVSQEALRILRGLEDLLEFLRLRFYQHFDMDATVTRFYSQHSIDRLTVRQKEIFDHRVKGLDQQLIKAVNDSLKDDFNKMRIADANYKKLAAVRKLLNAIDFALENPSTISFSLALYKENLNTLHFTAWYRELWQSHLKKLKKKQKREEYIRDRIIGLSKIFIVPDAVFEPLLPPIDRQLISWLEAQLSIKEQNYTLPASAVTEQMPLFISVAQFALFVRVFQKTGCFAITNAARIMRFFTGHFTTKMQAHISVKSFNHAFYSMDQITAAVVRDLLQKMIDYVNKTYFPK